MLTVVAAIELYQRIELFNIEWRDDLMGMFFYDISDHGLHEIANTTDVDDVCHGWEGIICEGEQVQEIRFHDFAFGDFNISALPPSVMIIQISKCGQKFEISTRSLPRKLIKIHLNSNHVCGRIDLTTLPIRLTHAGFRQNALMGPIDFTHLPKALRQIDLSKNKIQQETLWYDHLPKHLNCVFLDTGSKRSIQEIRPVDASRALQDKGIFCYVRSSIIH